MVNYFANKNCKELVRSLKASLNFYKDIKDVYLLALSYVLVKKILRIFRW